MDPVRPKKKLGQHFLKDENIARKIVRAYTEDIPSDVQTIEIGPGTGVLTRYLLQQYESFVAYDVDKESIEYLKKAYPSGEKHFLLQDFLNTDLDGELRGIIGNFPYNISSQIFFKIYENRNTVSLVVGMVQKEVADRITSPHGNKTYGILSVLLQAFYDVEYLFTVEPEVFNPPPKVRSAVIRLKRNNSRQLNCNEDLFKRVVKAGFQKRRKTLWNSLKDLNLPDAFRDKEIFKLRAEQLSVQQFSELTNLIEKGWKI